MPAFAVIFHAPDPPGTLARGGVRKRASRIEFQAKDVEVILAGGHSKVARCSTQTHRHSIADQGAIEDVLAVENDVVPFDRADVLEQGCVNAFLW